MRSHQAETTWLNLIMVARHSAAVRIRHRLRHVRGMRPAHKTAGSRASGHVSCHAARQQRERRGKQCQDYEHGLGSAHGE